MDEKLQRKFHGRLVAGGPLGWHVWSQEVPEDLEGNIKPRKSPGAIGGGPEGDAGVSATTIVKHLHIFLSKAHFYNLSRFRLEAWKLNVNNINLKHINRSMRFCNYCTDINNNIMEDEEHVIFGCPEYDTCRQ